MTIPSQNELIGKGNLGDFLEAGDGGETVGTLQKACDPCGALGQGTEHDTAVRDGFVTRNGDFSAQTIDFVKFHKNILHFPDRSREYRNVGPP